MADVVRYVNTGSTAGGDGTTNATTGANRAYPSLNAWNTAEVTDLVSDGDTHTVYCDGGADTATCDLTSWLISTTNTLTILPHSNSEHSGSLDTGLYHRSHAGNYDQSLVDTAEGFIVDGLQFSVTGNFTAGIKTTLAVSATRQAVVRNCIFKGGGNTKGIGFRRAGNGQNYVYNCIFYDLDKGIESDAQGTGVNNTTAYYNNTIENCGNGILLDGTGDRHHVKNNLIVNCTTDYQQDATPNATTATNVTSDATSPDGTTYQSKTITFTDLAGEDYSTDDSDVVGVGTDLSADGVWAFDTDILGNTRSAWDVGAFEDQSAPSGTTITVPTGPWR